MSADGDDPQPLGVEESAAEAAAAEIAAAVAATEETAAVEEEEVRFWTSKSAYAIYGFTFIGLLSHEFKFLYGVLIIIFLQTTLMLLKWAGWVAEDPAFKSAYEYATTWMRRFQREGKAIIADENSPKRVMWGTAVLGARTGKAGAMAAFNARNKAAQINLKEEIEEKLARYHIIKDKKT